MTNGAVYYPFIEFVHVSAQQLHVIVQVANNSVLSFYYMAHRSIMEMEHSDWILSGPYFAVRIWTNYFQKMCCIVQKGFSFEKVEWKKNSTSGNRS